MRSGVIAQKVGMTRVYNDAGEHVPVTVLRLDGCQVVAQRTVEKNGGIDAFLKSTPDRKLTDTARRIKRQMERVAGQ